MLLPLPLTASWSRSVPSHWAHFPCLAEGLSNGFWGYNFRNLPFPSLVWGIKHPNWKGNSALGWPTLTHRVTRAAGHLLCDFRTQNDDTATASSGERRQPSLAFPPALWWNPSCSSPKQPCHGYLPAKSSSREEMLPTTNLSVPQLILEEDKGICMPPRTIIDTAGV